MRFGKIYQKQSVGLQTGSNLPIALTLGDLLLASMLSPFAIGYLMTDRTHAMLTEPPLRLLLQMTAPTRSPLPCRLVSIWQKFT